MVYESLRILGNDSRSLQGLRENLGNLFFFFMHAIVNVTY